MHVEVASLVVGGCELAVSLLSSSVLGLTPPLWSCPLLSETDVAPGAVVVAVAAGELAVEVALVTSAVPGLTGVGAVAGFGAGVVAGDGAGLVVAAGSDGAVVAVVGVAGVVATDPPLGTPLLHPGPTPASSASRTARWLGPPTFMRDGERRYRPVSVDGGGDE